MFELEFIFITTQKGLCFKFFSKIFICTRKCACSCQVSV